MFHRSSALGPARCGTGSRHSVAATLAVLTLAGCLAWQPASQPARELVDRQDVGRIRVTLRSRQQFVMTGPTIRGDSLIGAVWTSSGDVVLGFPLAEVTTVEVERVSETGTIVAVGVTAALVVAVIWALRSGDDDGGNRQTGPVTGTPIQFSCPTVYTWDGTRWRIDSGTFGGAITRGLYRADADILAFASPAGGRLRLRVTNEMEETDHLDALAVIAVDQDSGLSVAPDPTGRLHSISALAGPVRATDYRGADALPRVRAADGWGWESSLNGRDPSRTSDLRDGLELAFTRPAGAQRAHLVFDGNGTTWSSRLLYEYIAAHGSATAAWYDSLDADPAMARAAGERLAREAFLSVAVRTGAGWVPQGMYWEAGPEVAKRQVVELDLGQVVGDTVRIRLESVPAFWWIDHVGLDFTADGTLTVHELPLLSARDRGGRDVARDIAAADSREWVLEQGDAAELEFQVPPKPAGVSRTFVLRSAGWYRIRTSNSGAPDVAALNALARDPLGISRAAVTRLNTALAALAEARR